MTEKLQDKELWDKIRKWYMRVVSHHLHPDGTLVVSAYATQELKDLYIGDEICYFKLSVKIPRGRDAAEYMNHELVKLELNMEVGSEWNPDWMISAKQVESRDMFTNVY